MLTLILFTACPVALSQVTAAEHHYEPYATVVHSGGKRLVVANDPRPLMQVSNALIKEYGWVIDFEDPRYRGRSDLVDATSPVWRQAHPGQPGISTIAGGFFTSGFDANAEGPSHSPDERSILNQMVVDYNASTNPGKFAVYDEGKGVFAFVGEKANDVNGSVEYMTPVLNTEVSLPLEERSLSQTIEMILQHVTAATGQSILLSSGPTKIMMDSKIKLGGERKTARALLRQALDQSGATLRWTCLYEPTFGKYHFNVIVASD